LATRFIAAIGELYAVESRAKDLSLEQRQQLRQTRSREILTQIETLLLQHLHSVLPGSLMGKALHDLANYLKMWVSFGRNST
jgi:transposase